MTDRAGALQGLRVLDLGRVLAAPLAAQTLGDLGAEVIKVEQPGRGDIGRAYGRTAVEMSSPDHPSRESSFHVCTNRNKRAITIDLTTAAGQQLVADLAVRCDVLIENFIGDTTRRYGIDYATSSVLNPRLVYCTITGYGTDSPHADRPGYDAVFQANSGLMSITGHPDDAPGGGPIKVGTSLMDVMAANNATIAILAALSYRDRVSGTGQWIDISLMDGAVACQVNILSEYLLSGVVPPRTGNRGMGGGPAEVFICADGAVYISAALDRDFVKLCTVVGQPDLVDDPRFATITSRGIHADALTAALAPSLATWSKNDLLHRLLDDGIPCAIVMDYDEVFADEHVRSRRLRRELPYPGSVAGTVPVIASPLNLATTPPLYTRHPPALGEHTDEVLRDVLDLDDEAIAALRTVGAI